MKNRFSIFLHFLIFFAVFTAWGSMTFYTGENGALSASGLRNLKYFTILSNLLTGIASLCAAICQIKSPSAGRNGRFLPRWSILLLYVSVASVCVTLLTVILFLGPLYGYRAMYYGPNGLLHLIIPLAAVAAFLLTRSGAAISFRDSSLCMLPVAAYGLGYVANNLVHGISHATDWYSFLAWGWPTGIFIFTALIILSWGIGIGLRTLYNQFEKNR